MTTEYIRVVAPATLKENFTFDVLLDGKPFTVVVPPGGVAEGEEFEIPYARNLDTCQSQQECDASDEENQSKDGDDNLPFPPTISNSISDDDDDQSTQDNDRRGAPYGRFRVSLCSCCDVLTQATFWMALCCFPVLLGQLLTRFRLKWNGHEIKRERGDNTGNEYDTKEQGEEMATFVKIILSFVVVLTLGYIPIVGTLVLVSFYLVTSVWIGGNLRRHVRQRYRIPGLFSLLPNRVEDRCTMFCCCCCAIIQVARHSHNDKEYPGYCCSTTGLEVGAPQILPAYSTAINNEKSAEEPL